MRRGKFGMLSGHVRVKNLIAIRFHMNLVIVKKRERSKKLVLRIISDITTLTKHVNGRVCFFSSTNIFTRIVMLSPTVFVLKKKKRRSALFFPIVLEAMHNNKLCQYKESITFILVSVVMLDEIHEDNATNWLSGQQRCVLAFFLRL